MVDLDLIASEYKELEGSEYNDTVRVKLISLFKRIRKLGYHPQMTLSEFIDTTIIMSNKLYPKHWRKGQKVFNYIGEVYGVARYIQFNYNIDCYYDDNKINEFLKVAFRRLHELELYERKSKERK